MSCNESIGVLLMRWAISEKSGGIWNFLYIWYLSDLNFCAVDWLCFAIVADVSFCFWVLLSMYPPFECEVSAFIKWLGFLF